MTDVNEYSIERLISLACRRQIISDYRMTPTMIRLYQGDTVVLESDPEEARFYLRGLIRGCWQARQSEEKTIAAEPVPVCWLCERYEEGEHGPDTCAAFPKGILQGMLRATAPASGPFPCGGKGFQAVDESAESYVRYVARRDKPGEARA